VPKVPGGAAGDGGAAGAAGGDMQVRAAAPADDVQTGRVGDETAGRGAEGGAPRALQHILPKDNGSKGVLATSAEWRGLRAGREQRALKAAETVLRHGAPAAGRLGIDSGAGAAPRPIAALGTAGGAGGAARGGSTSERQRSAAATGVGRAGGRGGGAGPEKRGGRRLADSETAALAWLRHGGAGEGAGGAGAPTQELGAGSGEWVAAAMEAVIDAKVLVPRALNHKPEPQTRTSDLQT
jgi:hypothetical protein